MKWVLLITVFINNQKMPLEHLEYKTKDACEAVKIEILSYHVFRYYGAEAKCSRIGG